jgi:GT2 family glycosyltransferase
LALSGGGAAIVPSLGEAPGIERRLARLRDELERAGAGLVWVQQGARPAPTLDRAGERLVRLDGRAGFARAVNAGIAAAGEVDWLALVNDDLEVDPGWLATLAGALAADARLGAVQGVNRIAGRPELADGCGIGWNRWHQAVQLGHGEPAPPADAPPFEVLGVSATGALYRRAALEGCRTARGEVFDERLGSWYEDVELAIRLRAAGWTSRCAPRARAAHLGSATGGRRPFRRSVRLVGNRWLVAASLLGRRLPRELPRLAARDLADLARALAAGELRRALGYPTGWLLAACRLPAFAHAGAPRLGGETLERFRVGSGA